MNGLPMLPALVAAGFAGGYYGAAVGSAGLMSVPVLILFGFSPYAAVATTRPAAFVLESMSALRYRREGRITNADLKKGAILGLSGSVGSVAGALFIGTVSDQTLRLLFALVILSMLSFLLMKPDWGTRQRRERERHLAVIALCTMVAGTYAGFFGFTFGTLMTIVLVFFGSTLLHAAALSRIIGTFTCLAATAVFISKGSIDYPAAAALGIGFGWGGWMGAGAGAKKGNAYIKKLLVLVVVVSALKLVWDYVSALL
jgi:uncharacterized membrane protein YfcA